MVGARRVVDDADLVFVLNEQERRAWQSTRRGRHLDLATHGVDPRPATDQERQRARNLVAGLHNAEFVVVVGRLDPGKGQDLAIEAFCRGAPEGMHLVLAGAATDPDYARRVCALAREAPRSVHVAGGVTPRMARALLAEASLALVPSRVEPFGIVLLEAWAEQTATLFSLTGGLARIADDAHAADFGMESLDVDSWANRIHQLLSNPTQLRSEGASGPGRVVARFSWRRAAEKLAAAYQNALVARLSS
jgi:glycosyltransferase involved in cell wall biosynthesis